MSRHARPHVLVLYPFDQDFFTSLQNGYAVHLGLGAEERAREIAQHGKLIRAVITSGPIGLASDAIRAMPSLEIVACMGAGYENVDLATTAQRGIVVAAGQGDYAVVADHAMALMLGIMRDLANLSWRMHTGKWERGRLCPQITGKRLGLLGYGSIGTAIAHRATGFSMDIAYHARRQRAQSSHRYYSSLADMAAAVDCLVIACPGGAETYHLVNRQVIARMRSDSYLVNVGRGSVVDTVALADALRHGHIAGAALDVVDGEPEIPLELRGLPNLLWSPHVAGHSVERITALKAQIRDALDAHFDGRPVPGRIL